jgi:3-deoxy-D-manno-octulosonate 8-phosphate phosphatase (KDO 8-P phosphatase)
MTPEEITERAKRIKLLLLDCDGVLTNGQITFLANNDEQKTFHVRDGQGIVMWHRAGLRSGVISGRTSSLVERRAKELGIEFIRQGSWNKLEDFEDILDQTNILPEETAFVGDDINDLSIMKRVGLSIAVADAAPDVLPYTHLITKLNGGSGAIREVTDMILKAQNKWLDVITNYLR